MIAKATSGRGRFSEVAKSWGGRKWVLDYSSPSCCHLCHKMGWGEGGSLPPSSSSSFVVGWTWSLLSTTCCCFWLFLPLFLDASFSFWKKFGEKNGVELLHTLQWKGVQVLNNIISYSGEFVMCTMTCEELKGEKNEIVVCNKYLWKCEKVELAITTCQLHAHEWLCQFWYW